MNYRRGFTLIELLVVIAIIGILSSVVLASLNSARSKGNDVGVKENVRTVATQAAIYLAENSFYGVFDDGSDGAETCPVASTTGSTVFHDERIELAVAAALIDSAGGSSYCMSNDAAFAVAVTRPTTSTTTSKFWCADSTGAVCGNDGNGGDNATPIVDSACVPCTTTQ